MFADFHKAYPDASVDRSKIDWDTMLPKLTAAVASGSPPDLFFFDSPVTEFGAASSDLLTPITDVIDSIGRKNWSKTMLDQASVNGEVYGFPLYAYPYVIWYRKDLLDKAGLQPPTTMAELLADAQLLNKPADKLYGIAMYNDVTSVDIAGQVIASFGGRLFDDNGNVTIDSPETVAAFAFLQELWKVSSPDAIAKTDTDQRLAFAAGGYVFNITSMSFTNVLSDPTQSKVTLDQVGTLQIPNGTGGKIPATDAPYGVLVIPKGAKNVEGAKALLRFWAQPVVMVKFGSETILGHIPVMTSVTDPSSPYWTSPRIAPVASLLRAGSEGATKDGFLVGGYPQPSACGAQVLAQGLYTISQSHLVVDKWTPEQTAKWFADQVKLICKK